MTTTFRQPFRGDYGISLDYNEVWEPIYPPGSPHKGIDYLTPNGTPILASADGTVIFASGKENEGYGKYIILSHADKITTVYAHLSGFNVYTMQQVKQGDVIGYSGNTGNSTGPHLHFEMRKNNTPIDPKTKLQNVFDTTPTVPSPTPVKPKFESLKAGGAIVVCDTVNARCHCDMSQVKDTLSRGDLIMIGDEVTYYMGLPFRDFYDPKVNCWLRIAEHDTEEQLIINHQVF